MSDLEQTAIERLKAASDMSLRLFEKPLVITYSGGKDSDVLLHLAQVSGSQRGGRIGKEDVQQFVKGVMSGGAPARAGVPAGSGGGGLDLIPWPKVDFAKFGEIETKPLTRIQKISGANLARNWSMIP